MVWMSAYVMDVDRVSVMDRALMFVFSRPSTPSTFIFFTVFVFITLIYPLLH